MKLTPTELHFITICAIVYGCGIWVVKIITILLAGKLAL